MVKIMEEDFKKAAQFHGHICPGLAMGYRIAKYVKSHYPRSEDEELVCIAENSSCSVDAVQELLGCTSGKGNLLFKDYGKQAFTFYSRDKDKALRIYFHSDLLKEMEELRRKYLRKEASESEKKEFERLREKIIEDILKARDEDILSIQEVDIPAPEKARIYPSRQCDQCGESFMEILGRTLNGKTLCQECFQKRVC
jgi:formylmethanofuran dehydrogenase subunit E